MISIRYWKFFDQTEGPGAYGLAPGRCGSSGGSCSGSGGFRSAGAGGWASTLAATGRGTASGSWSVSVMAHHPLLTCAAPAAGMYRRAPLPPASGSSKIGGGRRMVADEVMDVSVRVLGLDPGRTTGWFLARGYEPVSWGSDRDPARALANIGPVDVVVFEDALDLDRVAPLRPMFPVPWVGITPEQLQRRLFNRVLGRHQAQGPLARREVVRRGFGCTVADPHALDAAMAALWYVAGAAAATGAPDLGSLAVWDVFVIDAGDGEETYQVVPPNTADPAAGLVSWSSPLVQAIKNARPGDRVTVPAPGGEWECRLVRLEPRA